MSFLAPLFLLGALAAAGPVIIHLIRRTTRERQVFSSLMFLAPSPPQMTRRSRLEHILLLVTRCAVLCLLAAGFARPFIKQAMNPDPSGNVPRTIVVLLDTSASMRRGDLWAQAKEKARKVLQDTSPEDRLAIYTFDQQLNPLVTLDQWVAAPAGERAALANGKISETAPGWFGTHLGSALMSAAETLAEGVGKETGGIRRIVVISDFQEGSRLDQMQGYEWPKGVEVSVAALKPKPGGNAALQLVGDSEEGEASSGGGVRLRVSNSADSKKEQFKIGWATPEGRAMAGKATEIYVPAGQSRTVVAPAIPEGLVVERLILQGDDEEFDNSVFVIPPEQLKFQVVYLGKDSGKDSKEARYYLTRAFQDTRRRSVQILDGSATGGKGALIVVTDALADNESRGVHEAAVSGGTVLFAPGSVSAAAGLAGVLRIERVSVREAQVSNYAILGEIDFRHPLFAPFADPRFGDFTKIHFWKYRRFDAAGIAGARVLAKFDNGDPAVLEVSVGKGRVVVLASGWTPGDSQLALSTKFVPLLFGLLEQGAPGGRAPVQYYVGDTVPLAEFGSASSIRLPDGSQLNLDRNETNFSKTIMPGIYRVTTAEATKRVAVNLDPSESRTMPMPGDELERLGAPMVAQAPSVSGEKSRVTLQIAELENRQRLWRWVIAGALALVLGETWLAGQTARKGAGAAQTPVAEGAA